MNFEWWLAKRFLWSKRRHPFVGVVGGISVLGVAVGVAALIVVIAVMNGFDEDLKSRIIGMRAHVSVTRDGSFDNYGKLLNGLDAISAVKGAAPFVEGQALIQNGEWVSGVLVRGIEPEREMRATKFHAYLTSGSLTDRAGSVVIGSELAKRFGLTIGSKFFIVTQTAQEPKSCVVDGIFSSGLYEYDANLIFMGLKDAQALFEMKESVTGISVYLKNPDSAQKVRDQIQSKLGFPYYARTWMDMNRTLFGALKLEKLVMFLILSLIVLVACLNIAGSLTILVINKTRDIGVLKALGAKSSEVLKIFSYDGLMIGGVGAVAGCVIGLGLCWLLSTYSFVDLPKEIYYVERLPVRVEVWDTFLIFIVAIVLSFVCSFYPAWMASRLDPVKALRYE